MYDNERNLDLAILHRDNSLEKLTKETNQILR
jgi:hypothetical protein